MSDITPEGRISRKTAELCFAAFIMLFGIIMIVGAREMETGWGSSGPEAGYFPLRIGVLIAVVSGVIFLMQLFKADEARRLIKSKEAMRNLIRFALPLVVLIAVIPKLGIYLAAVIYLCFAVGVIARQRWITTCAVALLTPLVIFILFEHIFRTPLPKGPLGPLLGLL
jgi:putative tricarboxylic transport membrane protein